MFSKYYASGNDFVIVHGDERYDRWADGRSGSDVARWICDRYKGIGADGFIILRSDSAKLAPAYANATNTAQQTKFTHDYDLAWEFYNLDGSIASMCGNGSRACAHFAYHNALAPASMGILTGAGVIQASVDNDMVSVCLGALRSMPVRVEYDGVEYYLLDSGVPHLVRVVDSVDSFDSELCAKLRREFDANVNYLQIIDNSTLKVRTYERGVEAETLACGTGMGASFYIARMHGAHDKAMVYPTSMEVVEFCYDDAKLYFKGKVAKSFEAII